MVDRHADDVTLDHYIKLKTEHDKMNDILTDVAKWLKDLELHASPGHYLHPSLKRVLDWVNGRKG